MHCDIENYVWSSKQDSISVHITTLLLWYAATIMKCAEKGKTQ